MSYFARVHMYTESDMTCAHFSRTHKHTHIHTPHTHKRARTRTQQHTGGDAHLANLRLGGDVRKLEPRVFLSSPVRTTASTNADGQASRSPRVSSRKLALVWQDNMGSQHSKMHAHAPADNAWQQCRQRCEEIQ